MRGRGKIQKSEIREVKSPPSPSPNKTLMENVSNAANSIQGQKAEVALNATGKQREERQGGHSGVCTLVTEALQKIVGSDWSELDERVRWNTAKAVPDRFKPY